MGNIFSNLTKTKAFAGAILHFEIEKSFKDFLFSKYPMYLDKIGYRIFVKKTERNKLVITIQSKDILFLTQIKMEKEFISSLICKAVSTKKQVFSKDSVTLCFTVS